MTAAASLLTATRSTDVAARILEANSARRPVRIVGAGTWLVGSAPVDSSTDVSSLTHSEIVDYVPGDLTMTIGAGASLSFIERTTAANDQWLTLDPFGSPEGTIGATVATASSGPLASGFGAPRDLVLGIEAVTGNGEIIRAGGRVVKNVAGFDLVRLFTGSRGSLGMITEVSLRLRARPAKDETIAIEITEKGGGLRGVSRALRSWPFAPMAAEVLNARCASAVGLKEAPTLLVRLGGNARAVASQKKKAGALGKASVTESSVWARLRTVTEGATAVIRVSDLSMSFADRWEETQSLGGETGLLVGSPMRGTLRCVLRELDRAAIASFRAKTKSAAVVFESLPTVASWNSLTVEPEPGTLQGRVRAAFDPAGIMNPGAMRMAR